MTQHPTAEWTAQQVITHFGLIGRSSPQQSGFAERWIFSPRRDCLDHVIVINERQLRRAIRLYVDYYHVDRTHLGLEEDAPEARPIETRKMGKVVSFSRVGGLHHRYSRELRKAA